MKLQDRFLNVCADQWGFLLTVFGVGVILVHKIREREPELWWTRRFRLEFLGWVLRLTKLVAPRQEVHTWKIEWLVLDKQVLKASKLRLMQWTDLNVLHGFLMLSSSIVTSQDDMLYELGAGD